MTLALGVDIGGTKIAVGAVDARGVVTERRHAPTPGTGTEIIDTVVALCAELIDAGGLVDVPVGVGTAGVVDGEGVIISATSLLGEWRGTRVRELLEERLGARVAVVNDVHAHALGEGWRGAAAGCSDYLTVAVGTGIGGAIVSDGRLLAGTRFVAGHVGHIPSREAEGMPCSCGATGHLEAVASGSAILERAEIVGRDDAVRTAARALGSALGGLVNVLDPQRVVVTGGVTNAGEEWWKLMRAAYAAELLPATREGELVAGELGADAAIVGAARLVRGAA